MALGGKQDIGLFICATPIGNLGDASYRLISTLEKVDIIAAEDTRTTKKLLERYGIGFKNMVSFHDFSDEKKIELIISKILEGSKIALVSESGMPLISDPGYRLVNRCIANGIDMTVIPGPSAGISSLALSGLPTDSFLFIGFLPKSKGKRSKKISDISKEEHTLLFYESPNRIKSLLDELIAILGDRKAFLARELTKMHEEKIWGRLSDIREKLSSRGKVKGEITIIVEGYSKVLISDFSESQIREEFSALLSNGLSKKEALKELKSRYDIDRQRLYNISTNF